MIADNSIRVVVVGGSDPKDSARVIEPLPVRSTLAVIAHYDAGPEVVAAQLESARMPVERVVNAAKVSNGRIFVVPTDKHVEIRDHTLVVSPKTGNNTLDILLRSVADAFAGQTIILTLVRVRSGHDFAPYAGSRAGCRSIRRTRSAITTATSATIWASSRTSCATS